MKRALRLLILLAAADPGAVASACGRQVLDDLPAGEAEKTETEAAGEQTEAKRAAFSIEPTPEVRAFLQYVQDVYLTQKNHSLFRLPPLEMAKLLGYAVGEAAEIPAPVDVYAPEFRGAFEAWIGKFAVYGGPLMAPGGPAEADAMWTRIEEGARGFYDEDMQAKYGSVADDPLLIGISAWFGSLGGAEKDEFLAQAAKAGVARADGGAFSATEFEPVAVVLDAEMDRQDKSVADRRDFINRLAAGEPPKSSRE